jgi:glycosyltransferase involved in cell wall biosynthesis
MLLVERTPEAFADALRSLTPARAAEMGRLNREEIAARWSWDAWRDRYAEFFRSAVDAG